MRIGFDNKLYIQKQTENILARIDKFKGKLYLEFGGKLFDDYHAARVLPGFDVNGKIRLLHELRDKAEIIFVSPPATSKRPKCARTWGSATTWKCCASSTTSPPWTSR